MPLRLHLHLHRSINCVVVVVVVVVAVVVVVIVVGLFGTLVTTYRPTLKALLATQHPPGGPESPGWRCGSESGFGTAQAGTFCLELQLETPVLIGARSGVGAGVMQKLNPSIGSRSQNQRSWASFPGIGAGVGAVGTLYFFLNNLVRTF